MKPQSAESLRKADLAKIHIAKKQLALPDDEYRDLVLSVTGKDSASELDMVGRKKLLEHFKKIGFRAKSSAKAKAKPNVTGSRARLMSKVEALLADAGRPWSYADSLAKRICKRDSLSFCDSAELSKIIAALSIDAKRRAAAEEATQ